MKFESISLALLLLSSTPSLAIPQPIVDGHALTRDVAVAFDPRSFDYSKNLKRAGGGGGGGRGGGSSGGSSGGGSSSGGRTSGSSGSSSGSSSSGSSSGGRSSTAGGTSRSGSGVQPSYGGGRYYGGGATTPYTAGKRSPRGGIAPTLLLVSALTIFPGLWLAGAYSYPYTHPYTFRNRTATSNTTDNAPSKHKRQDDDGVEETKPVLCLCAENAVCGCDDDGNSTVLDQLIGDGSYAALNKTLVTVSQVNGTDTIVLNGTLPDGTVAANAASRMALELSGYWVMFAMVGATVWLV